MSLLYCATTPSPSNFETINNTNPGVVSHTIVFTSAEPNTKVLIDDKYTFHKLVATHTIVYNDGYSGVGTCSTTMTGDTKYTTDSDKSFIQVGTTSEATQTTFTVTSGDSSKTVTITGICFKCVSAGQNSTSEV